ncbi:MAG: ABC transporter permease [Alphaproteobacteria bacterium]|nr:ABC transporter permease [Alphaproteobacteria bacterium]
MFKNYLITAFRNLARHKLYSAINIGGLSIGLAACILIFLFVQNELSYDEWIPESERIVRMEGKYKGEAGEPDNTTALSPGALRAPLQARFGSMIESSARLLTENFLITKGDMKYLDQVNLIDEGFFEVLDLPMVAGDRSQMFKDYKSAVISERAAEKYFGTTDPIGQILDFDFGNLVVKVVAVMKNLPENTHFAGDIFLHFDESRYESQPWIAKFWVSSNVYTYLKLRDASQRTALEAAIPPFMDENAVLHPSSPPDTIASEVYKIRLMPLKDIHLHSTGRFQMKPSGDILVVYSFSAIAALILVIAIINFTNLSTARASLRAREIALRKVVGASRRQIIAQLLGETFLTTLIALLIAFTLVEISLPWFNEFVAKLLSLNTFSDPFVQAGLAAVVAVIVLGAGFQPAAKMSGFRPGLVLHSSSAAKATSARMRQTLTTLQFTISIGLMIATTVIYSQIKFAQSMERGLDINNKLTLTNMNYGPVGDLAKTVQQEIERLPGVNKTAFSQRNLPLVGYWDWPIKVDMGGYTEVKDTEVIPADHKFLEVYGAELIAGRFFSEDYQADLFQEPINEGGMARQTAIISEKTVSYYGFSSPEDAVGQTIFIENLTGTTVAMEIVGVVKDMNLRSARDTFDPLMFIVQTENSWALNIDMQANQVPETLQQIDAIWNRLVPQFPLNRSFVADDLEVYYQADKQRADIFASFSIFAILVSCLGLYGLAAFTAEQRTKEIGVRKVLGAKITDIVTLLTLQFSKPVLMANLIAWPVAWYFSSRWLEGFAFRIDLTVVPFITAGGLALLIACLTVAGHAFRSAKASPIIALRHE